MTGAWPTPASARAARTSRARNAGDPVARRSSIRMIVRTGSGRSRDHAASPFAFDPATAAMRPWARALPRFRSIATGVRPQCNHVPFDPRGYESVADVASPSGRHDAAVGHGGASPPGRCRLGTMRHPGAAMPRYRVAAPRGTPCPLCSWRWPPDDGHGHGPPARRRQNRSARSRRRVRRAGRPDARACRRERRSSPARRGGGPADDRHDAGARSGRRIRAVRRAGGTSGWPRRAASRRSAPGGDSLTVSFDGSGAGLRVRQHGRTGRACPAARRAPVRGRSSCQRPDGPRPAVADPRSSRHAGT